MRYLRWSKINDKAAWIAYNRMRGQQASALEHATPEEFWIDRTKCRYTDETGLLQNPSLPDCPQAVSAVKAIAIAASQGQKIYTITQKNAAAALPKLSLSRSVAEEIQNAIAAGKEVTVHEKAINAYGFSGFGYIIIDPETGVGGYLIEGKGSGAFAHGVRVGIFLLIDILLYIISGATASAVAAYIALILAGDIVHSLDVMQPGEVRQCYLRGIAFGFAWSATALAILTSGWAAGILIAFIGAIFSELVEVPTAPKCYFGVSMISV